MSSGKGSKPPRAPDYTNVVREQGAIDQRLLDQQTQANRPNQNTPFGSSTWSRDSAGNWTQNTSYDPQVEGLMRSQFGTQQGAQNLAQGFMGQMAAQGPFNVSGAPELATGVQQYGLPSRQQVDTSRIQPGQTTNAINYGTPVDTNRYSGPSARTGFDDAGNIQRQYDFSGAPAAPQYDDNARNAQEQAAYGRATQLMGRNFEESNTALENRLANQGITKGSEAYEREMRNAREAQSTALQNAAFQAVGVGADEAARQYTLGMEGRRQGIYEGMQQGQFANQAQNQQYNQLFDRAQFENQAYNQNFNQFMQGQAGYNQAQSQGYNQAFNNADFFNNANQLDFGMGLQSQQAQNQALNQQFNQDISANTQYFDQAMQNAQLRNQSRNQYMNDASMQYTMPMNMYQGLMGSSGYYGGPQFDQFMGAGQGQSPDLFGAANATFQGNLARYNAVQGGRAGMLGGIGSVIGGISGFF